MIKSLRITIQDIYNVLDALSVMFWDKKLKKCANLNSQRRETKARFPVPEHFHFVLKSGSPSELFVSSASFQVP